MNYELSDLIDIDHNKTILDSFCEVSGIAAAILGLEGNIILESRRNKICKNFHHEEPRTLERCIQNNPQLANNLYLRNLSPVYQCKNGLTGAVSPIIIENKHIATCVIGQFLLKNPTGNSFDGKPPHTASRKRLIWMRY